MNRIIRYLLLSGTVAVMTASCTYLDKQPDNLIQLNLRQISLTIHPLTLMSCHNILCGRRQCRKLPAA